MGNSNSKTNVISVIIDLIDKALMLYLEFMAKAALADKLSNAAKLLVSGLTILLIAFLFALFTWAGIMSMLFVYLQTFNLTLIVVLLILTLVNLAFFLTAMLVFLKLKKEALVSLK